MLFLFDAPNVESCIKIEAYQVHLVGKEPDGPLKTPAIGQIVDEERWTIKDVRNTLKADDRAEKSSNVTEIRTICSTSAKCRPRSARFAKACASPALARRISASSRSD